jgi:drug/metabolite transporter (DMT)-like permease
MAIAQTMPADHYTLSPATKGMAFGLAAVAMWASYLAYARLGVSTGLKPQDFLILRYGTAALIMLPWLLTHGVRSLGGAGWAKGAALAVFAGPLFIALGVGGYVFAPLSHGAVIQPAALTIGAMLAAWAFFGERPPRERALGVAVIIAGLVLIASAGKGIAGPSAWIGDILFVLAGLFWVGFTVLLRTWKVNAIAATAAVATVSAMVVMPAFITFDSFDRILALPPSILVTQIIVQGVFSGVLAVVAYGKTVEHLGAAKAALFPALVPAATLAAGIPITGEIPSSIEWAGAVAVTAGLAIAMGVVRRRAQNT